MEDHDSKLVVQSYGEYIFIDRIKYCLNQIVCTLCPLFYAVQEIGQVCVPKTTRKPHFA